MNPSIGLFIGEKDRKHLNNVFNSLFGSLPQIGLDSETIQKAIKEYKEKTDLQKIELAEAINKFVFPKVEDTTKIFF